MTIKALRQHATTIVLIVLACAAALTVLVVDRGAVTTTESEERKKNLFEAFRIDELTELSVTAQGKTARLVRGAMTSAGQRPWEVELDGARHPADEQIVDQYLGALDMGTALRRVPPASVDRPRFGLDSPRLEVKGAMGDRHLKLVIGGPAPAPEGAVYAEVDGQGVVVITRELAASLDVQPEAFRGRTFIPYAPDQIQAITLEDEGGTRRLVRSHDGGDQAQGFRMEGSGAGGSLRVSAVANQKLWEAIRQLDADAFLPDAEADRALQKKLTLSLAPRDPAAKSAIVEVGGACPGHGDDVVAIQRAPSRASACVPQAALDGLRMPAKEMVDRHVFGAQADEVTEVKMTAGAETVELARKGPQWHLRVPKDRSLDAETGRGFLEALLSVEADRVLAASERKPSGAPRAVVRLISVVPEGGVDAGDTERVEVIEVGAEQDGMVEVHRLDDDARLMVPKDRAAVLFPSESALRSRQIIDEPVQSFRALKIEGGGRVQRIERAGEEKFRLVEPKGEGFGIDDGLAADVLEAVSTLTVERWVDDKDPAAASAGLDKPRLVIEAQAGDRTYRIALGAPAGAGSFAREGSDQAVFVAPGALEAAADRWLLDRTVTRIDPEATRRITLLGEGGKKVVVEAVDGVFRIAGEPADPASTARAAAIRDALADMTAEGAVSLGKPDKAQGFSRPRLVITVEPEGVSGKSIRIAIGAGDAFRGTSVVYARRDGVDATYAIAQAKVRPLLEAVGVQ